MAKDQSGSSDFVSFFKSNKDALKNLQDMKAAQVPGQPPDIAEGDYVARVVSGSVVMRDFTIGGSKKKVPIIKFRLVVDRGAYEGTSLNKDYILGKVSDKSPMSEREIYQRCAQDLLTLGADKNCFSSAEALAEEVEGIAKEKPLVRIKVKINPKGYVNLYLNGLAEDSKSKAKEEDEDVEEVEDEEEIEDEDEEESEDSDDESEDEGDEEVELTVGDRVRYQPKGGRKSTWSIHGVDEDARTVSLRDVSGKVVKGVAWDDLELVG